MIATSDSIPHRDDWLDRIWRFASSGYVTLALAALLAATLAASAFVPQLPVGLDSPEMERQLRAVVVSYREAGPYLQTIGAFTILKSLWLRVLMLLLAYNLALRLTDQWRLLIRAWRPIHAPPPLRPGLASDQVSVMSAPDAVLERTRDLMRERYPVLLSETGSGLTRLYGRRQRVAALSGALFTLGLLLLLAGLALNLATGWHTVGMPLVARNSIKLPFTDTPQLALDEIAGDGGDTVSAFTLTWANGRRERLRAGYTRPAHVGDLWIVQSGVGAALEARASSGEQALLLQSLAVGGQASEEIHAPFWQAQVEQAFAIPVYTLTFRVVSYDSLPAQGISGPVFLVEAYRGDDPTPILTRLVETEAALVIDEVTVILRRDIHAVLTAVYLPGLPLLLVGALLALAGVALGVIFGWGPSETWVSLVVSGAETAVTVRTAAPLRGRAEVQRLAHAIEAAFAPPLRTDLTPEAAPGGAEGGPSSQTGPGV